jgi:hypothetical protein
LAEAGLEPLRKSLGKTTIAAGSAAESGAFSGRFDLDRLVEAIGNLTPADRAKLLAALGAKPTDGSER